VNAWAVGSGTPLDFAIESEKIEIANLLKRHRGKIATKYSILSAVSSGKVEAVKHHLAAGADVNKKDENGWTPLLLAAYLGNVEIVGLLVVKGANVNAKGKWEETPLHLASLNGLNSIVQLLIENGADVNAKTDDNETPLDWTLRFGRTETSELLPKHSGKTGEELEEVARGSILGVVRVGDNKWVKQHLAAGAGVNAKDEYGWAPLHLAASWGHKEIAELLINKGADVNVDGQFFLTPLDLAVFNGQKEIIEFLRKHGGRTRGETANGIPYLAYGKWELSIDGKGGLKYEVLHSADLKQWQVLETITLEASTQIYVDKLAAEQPIRFYRLRLVE